MARHLAILFSLFFIGTVTYAQTFEIGHQSVTFSDPARGGRSVPSEIYYPASTTGDNVAISPLGPFPVVVFGHGFATTWDRYDYLWDELVPLGYIMVFPKTESSLIPFPDHAAFGADMAFLGAKLQELGSSPGSLYNGEVANKTAIMGHSMGGGCTFLAAENNNNITTIITLAAAETNPSAIAAAASVNVPSLVIAGAEDCVAPPDVHQIPIYNALGSSCNTYWELTGGSHCHFTNGSATSCYLGEGLSCLGYGPFISVSQQHERLFLALTPWLENFLKDDCDAWDDFKAYLNSSETAGESVSTLGCSDEDAGCLALPVCVATSNMSGMIAVPAPTGTSVSLSWSELAGADLYQAKGRRAGTVPFGSFSTGNNFKNVGGLDPGTIYEWKLRARCTDGSITEFSPLLQFMTGSGARMSDGIGSSIELAGPADGNFLGVQVNSSDSGQIEWMILDMGGRLLQSGNRFVTEGTNQFRIETNRLVQGIYLLQVKLSNKVFVDKFSVY